MRLPDIVPCLGEKDLLSALDLRQLLDEREAVEASLRPVVGTPARSLRRRLHRQAVRRTSVLLLERELQDTLYLEDERPLLEYDSLPGEESLSDEDDIPHKSRLVLHSRTTVQHLSVMVYDRGKYPGVGDAGS